MSSDKQNEIILYSNISLEDCKEKLLENIYSVPFILFSPIFFWQIKQEKPIGNIKNNTLKVRKLIYYRNSWQPILTAKLIARNNGTIIQCSWGLHPFTKFFSILWIAIVLTINICFYGSFIFSSIFSLGIQISSLLQSDRWIPFLIPIGMLIFGISLYLLCSYLAKKEAPYLLEFVITTLNAKEYLKESQTNFNKL